MKHAHLGYDSVNTYVFFCSDTGKRLAATSDYFDMQEIRQDLESQGYIVADY